MKKIKFNEIYCNMCEEQIRYDDGTWNTEIGKTFSVEMKVCARQLDADLCQKCGEKVEKLIFKEITTKASKGVRW